MGLQDIHKIYMLESFHIFDFSKFNKTLKRLESSYHKLFRKCDLTLFEYLCYLMYSQKLWAMVN